jgi:hypothetical protein
VLLKELARDVSTIAAINISAVRVVIMDRVANISAGHMQEKEPAKNGGILGTQNIISGMITCAQISLDLLSSGLNLLTRNLQLLTALRRLTAGQRKTTT